MGVLDAFRSDKRDNGEQYEGFLRASDIPSVPEYRATVVGFGVAQMEDGRKPYVILEGGFGRRALILNQRNGRTLAKFEESDLEGATVYLSKRTVDFRGKTVDSITVTVPAQSKPEGA